jgi:hypothetical protein
MRTGTNWVKLMMTMWASYGKLRLRKRLAPLAWQLQENPDEQGKGSIQRKKTGVKL